MSYRLGTALALALLATAATAAPVTLISSDGFSTVEGDLIEFDDDFYVLQTSVGRVNIPAADVRCEGPGCPQPEPVAPSAALALMGGASPDLLARLAASFGSGSALLEDGEAPQVATLTLGETAREVAVLRLPSDGEAADMAELGTAPVHVQGALANGGAAEILALDALVVVASPDVGIESISAADLAAVFAGDIINWRDLGGPDAPIVPLVRNDDAADRQAFEDLVMEPYGRRVSDRIWRIDNNPGIAAATGEFGGVIGVTRFRDAGQSKILGLEGACGIVSMATPDTLATGTYPFTEAVYLDRGASEPPEGVAALLEHAATAAGRTALAAGEMVPAVGMALRGGAERGQFIAALVESGEAMAQGSAAQAALATLINDIFSANHLTASFRFGPGLSTDAAWHRDQRARLIDFARSGALDGQELIFAGFAGRWDRDAGGDIAASEAIARATVEAVLREAPDLAQRRQVRITARGYGGVAPLACADTPFGDEINTRVEVWARPLPALQ